MNVAPTSATVAKDRLYGQLASSFGRLNRAITRTADLCDELQTDLHSMSMFAGLDAAKFMAIASELNSEEPEDNTTIEGVKN